MTPIRSNRTGRTLGVLSLVTAFLFVPALAAEENGRRQQDSEPIALAFEKVSVSELIPFIAEMTGKVVIPHDTVLIQKITIVSDEPVARSEALDLVFLALQQQGVCVVENDEIVVLRSIQEVDRQDVPVIGPDDSVLDRTDRGVFFQKVYRLNHASAENLAEVLEEELPDYAKLFADPDSNQVVVLGNIGLLQRLERIVVSLDQPNAASLESATFHLRYADAEQVAENIEELYGEGSSSSTGRTGGNTNSGRGRFEAFFGGRGGGQNQSEGRSGGSSAVTSGNLRVTANTQQNSITVLAEGPVIDQISDQIRESWDLPLPEEAVIPRVYDLVNSDPIKVRDLLEGLFGEGSQESETSGQGVGRLAGQFSFEAIPEAGRLVVVSKSPDHLGVIDRIIEDLDQPQTAGLPKIVELKHASAEELAEQLNTLLAEEGTLASIPRQESELSDSTSSASPFASDATDTTNQQNQAAADTINFWWQRSRPPTDYAGSSNLVGKIRIVPVWRQNALMIMAPAEYQSSVVDLISLLDRPGRQVLIKAVIAEISLEDALALGIRGSSTVISPNDAANSIAIGSSTTGQQNNLLPGLFDTSVLDVSMDINLLLQALAQDTEINILSEPRIFTSDNQEAEFFDGQDIPFVTDTQNTDNGNVINSFDYRAVGIQLRVRPRITPNRQVDLEVNLELSSIQPQATLFGGFIVDRRETTTHTIVQDGQTIIISGILRSEESDVKRKIPLLGDIPLLGALFTSTEREVSKTELLAFITPVVVENEFEAEELNEPFRDRLGELREQLNDEVPEGDDQ